MDTQTMTIPWKTAWLQWQEKIVSLAPNLLAAVFILIVSYLLAHYCKKITQKMNIHSDYKMHLTRFIGSIVSSAIIIIGIITALATAGINVAALITSLGLLGFSLGMAFKDLLANTIAGTMIMIYQPFKLNDTVEVTNSTGKIVDINMRYTTLINDSGTKILIPNQTLLSSAISVVNCTQNSLP